MGSKSNGQPKTNQRLLASNGLQLVMDVKIFGFWAAFRRLPIIGQFGVNLPTDVLIYEEIRTLF